MFCCVCVCMRQALWLQEALHTFRHAKNYNKKAGTARRQAWDRLHVSAQLCGCGRGYVCVCVCVLTMQKCAHPHKHTHTRAHAWSHTGVASFIVILHPALAHATPLGLAKNFWHKCHKQFI